MKNFKFLKVELNGWKLLVTILLILGIFFRFAGLEQKVFNADEVRGLLRLSGHTSQEFVEQVFDGDIVGVEDLQRYQKPTSEKQLTDAINALAGNPEHTPLYYLLVRFWMQWFSNPISAKALSVLISLFVFPCLYWLCLELFKSSLVGWVAIALITISPYHILLSQGAREYSFWVLTTVLSSAVVLKALRLETTQSWLLYTITLVAGFYSHLFFILVSLSHGIYVFIIARLQFRKHIIPYLLSSTAALLMFVPWILIITTNLEKLQEKTQWVRSNSTNLRKIIESIHYTLGNVFLDFNDTTRLEKYLDLFLLILIAYSLYFLCRRTSRRVWLFLLTLIGITALAQIVPDLIWQGRRSLQARYFIPAYLAIQLAVAYLIAICINGSIRVWQQRFWKLIFSGLLIVGIISGALISQSRDWDYLYQKGTASSINIRVSTFINEAERPLVISEATHSFILALSYLTDANVKFQLFNPNDETQWEQKLNLSTVMDQFSDIFVLYADDKFLNFVDRDRNFQRELGVSGNGSNKNWLYRVVRK